MSDGATTMKSKLKIGLKYLGISALSVLGGIQYSGYQNVEEVVTVVDNGIQNTRQVASGSTVRLNNRVHSFSDTILLAQTGGVMAYDVASVDPADYFSGSGILTKVGIMWDAAPAGGTYDISWATAVKTASSSTLIRESDNRAINSGGLILFHSGSGIRWNGALRLKVSSLTDPTSTSSGWLLIEGYEDLSE